MATYEILKAHQSVTLICKTIWSHYRIFDQKENRRFCRNDFFDKDGRNILFGKHKGEKVDTILERNQVISWIQNADFPLYTKKVLTAIKLKN
jgi:DNA polymerase-3 subunit epsilon